MKLGMPVLFEYNTVEENVKLAKELNLDFIELNLNFSYCREYLEKQDFTLFNDLDATLHFYDEADFASYEEVTNAYIKLLEKYLEYGNNLIKVLNIHLNEGPVVTISGTKNYIYDKEYNIYIERLVKNINKVKQICDKYNVLLVIENVIIPKYLEKTYERLQEENYYFNFDIGHDNNNNDTLYKLNKKNNLIFKEFHIHDGNRMICHLTIGSGNINISEFKRLAIEANAYVVLEVKCSEDLKKSVKEFIKL